MPLFLEQADYDRLLKPELLQQLTGGDTTLRDAAEHSLAPGTYGLAQCAL